MKLLYSRRTLAVTSRFRLRQSVYALAQQDLSPCSSTRIASININLKNLLRKVSTSLQKFPLQLMIQKSKNLGKTWKLKINFSTRKIRNWFAWGWQTMKVVLATFKDCHEDLTSKWRINRSWLTKVDRLWPTWATRSTSLRQKFYAWSRLYMPRPADRLT